VKVNQIHPVGVNVSGVSHYQQQASEKKEKKEKEKKKQQGANYSK
jgi:hypothetical protein